MATQMAALRNLTHYRMGFRVAVAAATIGVIYGYDLGNISGALLFITKEFDLSTKQTEWVTTIVVAGSIVGALAASRLANAVGGQPTMVLIAITYAIFAVLSGLAPTPPWLFLARFFLRVAIRPSFLAPPLFLAPA